METVRTDEALNWPAKIVNGELVIEAISETIVGDDGSQSVVMKLPSLALIQKFKDENDIK